MRKHLLLFLCHHRLEQLNATVRWTVDPRWGHFDIRVGTTRAVARQQKAVSLRNFGRIQNNPLSGKSADMVVASKQQESENSLFTNSLFYAIILPVLARWCSRLARQPVTLEVDGSSPFRVAKKVILRDDFFSYPKKRTRTINSNASGGLLGAGVSPGATIRPQRGGSESVPGRQKSHPTGWLFFVPEKRFAS